MLIHIEYKNKMLPAVTSRNEALDCLIDIFDEHSIKMNRHDFNDWDIDDKPITICELSEMAHDYISDIESDRAEYLHNWNNFYN